MGSLSFDLDAVANSMRDDLRKEFISKAKRKAMDAIEKHFEDTRIHTGGGRFQHIRGAGAIAIDDFIVTKYIDEAGMQTYMQKFFDENYHRIMDECLTKAITHQCNRLAFAKVQEMKPTLEGSTSFNPATSSPETALQMAAVIHHRDNPQS